MWKTSNDCIKSYMDAKRLLWIYVYVRSLRSASLDRKVRGMMMTCWGWQALQCATATAWLDLPQLFSLHLTLAAYIGMRWLLSKEVKAKRQYCCRRCTYIFGEQCFQNYFIVIFHIIQPTGQDYCIFSVELIINESTSLIINTLRSLGATEAPFSYTSV